MTRRSYAGFVTSYPWVPLLLVVAIVIPAAIVDFTVVGLPDFETPTDGFEARGSVVRARISAEYNLLESSFTHAPITNDERRRRSASRDVTQEFHDVPLRTLPSRHNTRQKRSDDCIPDYSFLFTRPTQQEILLGAASLRSYFRIVLKSNSIDPHLFRADALRAICHLEDRLILTSPYVASECSIHSAGRLVARVQGTTCQNVTDGDVAATEQTLYTCAPHYFRGNLTADCLLSGCADVPAECGPEIFTLLHYIMDYKYFDANDNGMDLQYVQTIVDIPDEQWVDFYMENLFEKVLANEEVKIAGIDSIIKFDIFNNLVKRDMRYFLLAGAVIVVLMCLYMRSLLMTFATLLIIAFSLVVTYFLYFIVFGITFFPFINIFSIIILIAIGADDVFILYDTWNIVKKQYPDNDIPFWFSKTMNHAALSVFVTSLTTSTAFLANIISEITNIQLFGIFAGVAILCNFFLMISFIPAVIILIEWFENRWLSKRKCCACCVKLYGIIRQINNFIFSKALNFLVCKLWFIWIPLFAAVGTWGLVATVHTPRLKLPTSSVLSLFSDDNPLERFEASLQYRFRDAVEFLGDTGLLVSFVWGVEALDNGDHFDPHDFGELVLDKGFQISSVEAWLWMRDFCHIARNASFSNDLYASSPCLMQLFEDYITAPCVAQPTSACCGHGQPYPQDIFHSCFEDFIVENQNVTNDSLDKPYFNSTNHVVAYSLYIPSTLKFSGSFEPMEDHFELLDSFTTTSLATAPVGLGDGWFISQFLFYDLQRALSSGSFVSIGVSLSCAAVVMLMTSLNVLITLYAILTILLTIFFTVGVLVMLDWELNVLESIIITGSVGLSIDFAIHYGIAYRLAESPDRVPRVQYSLTNVGSSVAMASLTTFLAGTSIYFSDLVGYQQLSVFLMLVMFGSWSFATFLFLSICRVIGPNGNCAQIPSPFSCCMKPKAELVARVESDDSGVGVFTTDTQLHTNATEKTISDLHVTDTEYNSSKDEGYHEDSDRTSEPSQLEPYDMETGEELEPPNANNNNPVDTFHDIDTYSIPPMSGASHGLSEQNRQTLAVGHPSKLSNNDDKDDVGVALDTYSIPGDTASPLPGRSAENAPREQRIGQIVYKINNYSSNINTNNNDIAGSEPYSISDIAIPPITEASLSDINLEPMPTNTNADPTVSLVNVTSGEVSYYNQSTPSGYQNPGFQAESPLPLHVSVVNVTSAVVSGEPGISDDTPLDHGHHNPSFEP